MSWVERELREQPEAVARFLAREHENVARLARQLIGPDVNYLLIASRGSSGNAARYAQYVFGARNGLPVAFSTPSLYTLYETPPRLDGALVIGISQSGASPDVVAVLAEARRQGRPTLAFTNETGSALANAAEWVVPLHAGDEHAVAATKTYLTSIAAVALLSAVLDEDETRVNELLETPGWIATQVELSLGGARELDRYSEVDGGSVVARGVNLGTAFEIALKIRELSGAPFEPFSSADLLHGPVVLAGAGVPMLVIRPDGRMGRYVDDAIVAAEQRGGTPFVIGGVEVADRAGSLRMAESLPEALTPIVYALPGQLLAEAVGRRRGLNPDQPGGLRKVTRTR